MRKSLKENAVYFKNRSQWRKWLRKNHRKEKEIWLGFYKKHTKKPSIPYNHAVEEALCFGWIDSKLKKINDEKHMQRYTPRKNKSVWAKTNKERVKKLIKQGKMTKAGLEKVKIAKETGKWQNAYTSRKKLKTPSDLKKALMKDKKAWENFRNFANSYQNMYIGWVIGAKTEQTRKKRIKRIVQQSKNNKKLITM